MVALDPLLKVLGDVDRSACQEARLPGVSDRWRIRAGRIGADPVRGEQGLILQHLAEEPLGSLQVVTRRETTSSRPWTRPQPGLGSG